MTKKLTHPGSMRHKGLALTLAIREAHIVKTTLQMRSRFLIRAAPAISNLLLVIVSLPE